MHKSGEYDDGLRKLYTYIWKQYRELHKEHKLDYSTMYSFLKDISCEFFEEYLNSRSKDGTLGDCIQDKVEVYGNSISEESVADLRSMWENMMGQVIDYVNSHEDVKDALLKTEKEYTEGPDRCHIFPDLRFCFAADGLDESVKEKKWVPYTDSYIGIQKGIHNIIELM